MVAKPDLEGGGGGDKTNHSEISITHYSQSIRALLFPTTNHPTGKECKFKILNGRWCNNVNTCWIYLLQQKKHLRCCQCCKSFSSLTEVCTIVHYPWLVALGLNTPLGNVTPDQLEENSWSSARSDLNKEKLQQRGGMLSVLLSNWDRLDCTIDVHMLCANQPSLH